MCRSIPTTLGHVDTLWSDSAGTLRETGRAVPGQKAESGQTRDTGRATEKHGHLATQTRSLLLTNISRLCERIKKLYIRDIRVLSI